MGLLYAFIKLLIMTFALMFELQAYTMTCPCQAINLLWNNIYLSYYTLGYTLILQLFNIAT
jgi:hypothetical protein